jgi:putative ABC transport system permease protein
MRTLLEDLRFSYRMLIKKPGFTLIAVATIALGIGANSAIFSVINAVLLNPLPFPNSEQLVMVWGKLPAHELEKLNASPAEFVDYRDRNHTFSAAAVYASLGRNLTGAGEPERHTVTFVTADLFPLLEVQPLHGRAFFAEEDRPGHEQVVILSYGLWQRRFAGDERIVGQSVMLDGKSHTVVGVMPASFQFPDGETAIWKPMAFTAEDLNEDSRGSHYLNLIGRLKPGVTLEQAQADIASIARQMQQEHPDHYEESSGWGANVVSLRDEIVGDTRLILIVLLCAVGFVLLIACTNVANLLLARAATRRREIAIRQALGAGRARIIRQLLTESLALSLVGGALGVLLALWGEDLLAPLIPASLPRAGEIDLDARVIGFTFALSLLTGIFFGIIPALQATNLNLNETLKEGGGKATESKGRLRLRGLLVAGEIALALVLLVGAGLMIKSLYRLQQVDLGFDPANVVTMRLALPQSKYPEPVRQRDFFDRLTKRIDALPGVTSVGLVNFLPLSGSGNQRNISVEGKPENPINVEFRISNAEYFRSLNIPLREGRSLEESDRENSTYVTVVNETFTKVFLPGEAPLGKRVKMGGLNSPFRWLEIVGVVKDVKHRGLDLDPRPEMYISYLQPPLANWNLQNIFIAVRSEVSPETLLPFLREAVKELDNDQPIYSVYTMNQLVSRSIAPRRFNMVLMGIFSALALLLASIGIYGVMSYAVTERTHEIGIRMALGAQTVDVLRLVIGQGMKLAVIGVGVGLIAAFALTRLMESLLFKVSATDALTFAVITLLLTGVALAACYIPARRAMKVDPMVALRYE